MREGADGVLWIGTRAGLYRYVPDARRGRVVGDGDTGLLQPIDALQIANDGAIWVGGGHSRDLARHDPASGENTLFRRVVEEGIWDIHQDADGTLWLASGRGLIHFDPTSQTTTQVGAGAAQAGSVYYSILPDDAGRLWLGTNKGLVRYDPSRPDAELRRYDLTDGLGNLEFNRRSAFKNGAGELFFGGMNGVTAFHPSAIRDNLNVPPVVFTGIQVLSDEGERNPSPSTLETLTLSWRDYTVSFEFAALNFTESQNSRYAYMLEGFDGGWIDGGTRRAIRYTNLPPGDYVFRVKGSNGDGVWNEQGAALPVTVLPPYWQTWWFRLLGVASVAALLAGVYRRRIRRVVELEQMRLRIARDLHDELGSELSGIALTSSMLERQGHHLTGDEKALLADMAAAAAYSVEGLRDVAWYINPEHDTLQSMEQRMKSFADRLLRGVSFEFQASGTKGPLAIPTDFRRHVFLIYKELLHNIVRHAGATRVDIRLDVTDSTLRLEVADDGVGVAAGGGGHGAGLKSMRQRAAQLDADLTIDSRPGEGTRVRLVAHMTRSRRGRARRGWRRLA
jgi:signal transduction histidine kinase